MVSVADKSQTIWQAAWLAGQDCRGSEISSYLQAPFVDADRRREQETRGFIARSKSRSRSVWCCPWSRAPVPRGVMCMGSVVHGLVCAGVCLSGEQHGAWAARCFKAGSKQVGCWSGGRHHLIPHGCSLHKQPRETAQIKSGQGLAGVVRVASQSVTWLVSSSVQSQPNVFRLELMAGGLHRKIVDRRRWMCIAQTLTFWKK